MKRILAIALVSAIALILLFSTSVLADDGPGYWEYWAEEGYWNEWEEEGHLDCWPEEGHTDYWEEEGHLDCWPEEGHNQPDTLIRDNDNFFRAVGFNLVSGVLDDVEAHNGGERPPYADGYDIYQDDGSGEGWLERVQAWSQPDTVYWAQYDGTDLSPLNNRTTHQLESLLYFDQEPGTYYVTDVEAGCVYVVDVEAGSIYVVDKEAGCIYVVDIEAGQEWIVTLEAGSRWINTGTLEPGIRIILPDASDWFEYCGYAVSAIDFNDGIWRIQIPAGTWISHPSGAQAVQLKVDSDGNLVNGVSFTYQRGGEVTITKM